MKENEQALINFFNEFPEIRRRKGPEVIKNNLIPLYYNNGQNKGVGTIIKKRVEKKIYNEQDYPIILKNPGIMKIEQIFYINKDNKDNKDKKDKKDKKDNKKFYLLITEESLSDLNHLNKTLHENSGYNILKICNSPFNDIMGETLLKYFIRQLIYLLEFIDRSNLCFKELSLNKFFVSKKDFLLRLYNFKDIINLDDEEKSSERKSKKKNNEKSEDNLIKMELERKKHYLQIGKCIYDFMFGNSFFRNENENSESLFEDKKVDLIMRYIKKIKTKNIDQNIKNLLIKLIDFEPKNRPNIEEIFRNKWIHQDYNIINDIIANFEKDIIKIIEEFAKQDYLQKLKMCVKKDKKKNNENNDNFEKNNNNIILEKNLHKKQKIIKTGRFTFKKKSKKNSFNF